MYTAVYPIIRQIVSLWVTINLAVFIALLAIAVAFLAYRTITAALFYDVIIRRHVAISP